MEETNKRKIEVQIAGIEMSLVTDESDGYVKAVVKTVDETMRGLLRNIKRSQLDAALLCAIDFCGEMINSEKKARNLEAQISLYDVNMRRLKDEISSLKRRLDEVEKDGKQIGISEEAHVDGASPEEGPAEEAPAEGEDKLRMIEDMLRRKK